MTSEVPSRIEQIAAQRLALLTLTPDLTVREYTPAFARKVETGKLSQGQPFRLEMLGFEDPSFVADCAATLADGEERSAELGMSDSAYVMRSINRHDSSDGTCLLVELFDSQVFPHVKRQLAQQEERLEYKRLVTQLAAGVAEMGVWNYDYTAQTIEWNDQLKQIVGGNADSPAPSVDTFFEMIVPSDRAKVREALDRTIHDGVSFREDFRLRRVDGEVVWLVGRGERMEVHGVSKVVGMNVDITQRKNEVERLTYVTRELDHRVKNLLAVITSICRLTRQSASDLNDFVTGFEDRLQSMAKAHDLLAAARWESANLAELFRNELDQFQEMATIDIVGPPVQIGPSITQSFAMMIHELTTNALKFGALHSPGGRLRIDWEIIDDALRLRWTEYPEHEITQPQRKGYGTTVLNRILRDQMGADTDVDFSSKGLKIDALINLHRLAE